MAPLTLVAVLFYAAIGTAAPNKTRTDYKGDPYPIPTHPYGDSLTYDMAISVPGKAPFKAGVPLESFVSFSIEFSSFPDFAGNLTVPNTYSNNLLNNLGAFQGSKPMIRVGGNTADYAIFNASLGQAMVGIIDPEITPDYPTTIIFGPDYYESYHAIPDTKYVAGFNLAENSTEAREAMLESVPYACKSLRDIVSYWELGNEADLFVRPGGVRPPYPEWDEQDYADEFVFWSRQIRKKMREACPEMASDEKFKFYATSFAGTGDNDLDPVDSWAAGLNTDGIIGITADHNYVRGATEPGVTLQTTLMNHTSNVETVARHLLERSRLRALPDGLWPEHLPFILGETNSLFNAGRPGLSNTFGAALWGVDFNLWCATNNISRTHMHQGTNYRYQSWQPVETDITPKGTKAPYYGNIAVAAFMGDIVNKTPQIANIPLPSPYESAYAAYVNGHLARMMVLNLQEYNATDYNNFTNDYPRPDKVYHFQVPDSYCGKEVSVHRLIANGSDAISGITFDGWSYNWELDEGRPVRLDNVTIGETVAISENGVIEIVVPRSSVALLRFEEDGKDGGY